MARVGVVTHLLVERKKYADNLIVISSTVKMEGRNRKLLCIAGEGAVASRSVIRRQTPNMSFLMIVSEGDFDAVQKRRPSRPGPRTHPTWMLLTVPVEVMEAHLMCLIP